MRPLLHASRLEGVEGSGAPQRGRRCGVALGLHLLKLFVSMQNPVQTFWVLLSDGHAALVPPFFSVVCGSQSLGEGCEALSRSQSEGSLLPWKS